MSTTFSTLVTDVQAFLEDDGTEFVAALPRIINNGLLILARVLRVDVHIAEEGKSTTPGQRFLSMTAQQPLHVDNIVYPTGKLIKRRSQTYCRMFAGRGKPEYFCNLDDAYNLLLAPVPDQSYTMLVTYWTRPAELSTANEENWYTRHCADLLFKACLYEACEFLKNAALAAQYKKDVDALLALAVIEHGDLAHQEGSA